MLRYRWVAWIPTLLAVTLLAAPASAQMPEGAALVHPDDVEWSEIAPGVDFGDVYGTFTEGAHGKIVRFEPGLVSPMHTHTHPYHGVVIQGIAVNPYDDEGEPVEMGPGTYWYVPGGAPHRTGCVSEEPCLLYTHGDTAWDIQMVEEPAAEGR